MNDGYLTGGDMYKQTGLTVSLVRQILDYDPLTGVFVWKVGKNIGAQAGCDHGNGYQNIALFGRKYRSHVLAYAHYFGKWPAQTIDHIDGNKGNNAIANLRDVSQAVNSQNMRCIRRDTESGYLGVKLDKRDGKFEAKVHAHGKYHHIGRFTTAEAAHEAYIAAKRQLHEGCTL